MSLNAYSAIRVVNYYLIRMQIEEDFRDTKSKHYGLDFSRESQIQGEYRANLLLIPALIVFALWLVGLGLKGSTTEHQIRVNSRSKHSPYSVDYLGKIECRYVLFELPVDYFCPCVAVLLKHLRSHARGVKPCSTSFCAGWFYGALKCVFALILD